MGAIRDSSGAPRPRRPRNRAKKRRVAPPGFVPVPITVPQNSLSAEALHAIAATLPRNVDPCWLSRSLQDIAGSYLRRRDQPEPSRDEARYQLRMIIYELADLYRRKGSREERNAALRPMIGQLNLLAASHLWGGLDAQPDYPSSGLNFDGYLRSPDVDWGLVARAAATAAKRLGGGDYSDATLSAALQDLVAAFEQAAAEKATFSRTAIGPTGKGSRRGVAGSAAGRFALEFFRHVDTKLPPTLVSNSLEKLLKKRRATLH